VANQIQCPNCNKSYQIDGSKVDEKGSYATCRGCRHRLLVRRLHKPPDNEEEPSVQQIKAGATNKLNISWLFCQSKGKGQSIARSIYEWSLNRVRWIVTLCVLFFVGFTGYFIVENFYESREVDQAALQRVQSQAPNLQNADLRGVKIRGVNLMRADLSGANLQGANLHSANLYEANLSGANLVGADLEMADLPGANLSGANLRGADLEDADLPEANLQGTDLRDADLRRAYLSGVDLQGADLRMADLRNAIGLTIEQLSGVKSLYGTKLSPTLKEQVNRNLPSLLKPPE
jgi:uncharacterized protein YjbI with pentapeptide repeats/DNA-directed RNA polymerase subunit RPC12/RpoP